jgi:hypothetical protein
VWVGWCTWSPSAVGLDRNTTWRNRPVLLCGGRCYRDHEFRMLCGNVAPRMEEELGDVGFQQDGAAAHTAQNWGMCGSNSSHSSKLGDGWFQPLTQLQIGGCVVPTAHTAPNWGMCGSNSSHNSKLGDVWFQQLTQLQIGGCVVPTAHTAPNWGMCGSNSSKFNECFGRHFSRTSGLSEGVMWSSLHGHQI